MAKKNADELSAALARLRSNEPLARVYLLCGEDSCSMEQIIQAISDKRFKGGKVDPLSWEVYRAVETDAQKVIDSVRTISMFGGVKVVVYHDIDKLPESELLKLSEYAASPVRAHLVMTALKMDSRRKSWTGLCKNAQTISCGALGERDLVPYIAASGKARKLAVSGEAAEMLGSCIGPNRSLIERALDKLKLAVPEGTVITPDIIETHVIDTRERSVFELTRAISSRNIPAALEALRVLLEQRQEPVMINGMLARHARMLLQVKLARARNMPDSEIAHSLGLAPFMMRDYLPAVKLYSIGELYRFHAEVYECDRALKSKPVPPELVLSRLLMGLMKSRV